MTETFNSTPAPRKKRIAIVDTSSALEEQSRDIAEEKLTTAAGELHGVSGFVSKIWKHNLFREYYRQKEIAKAKGEISLSGNLYTGEGANRAVHNEVMTTIVDRFTNDYDEAVHTEAGEEKRVLDSNTPEGQRLNYQTRLLIRDYAGGIIDEASFRIERDRIVADATGLSGEQLRVAVNHTDNLLEIARQSKLAYEHGESLDAIDQEVEIVVGKAKLGVRTEAKYNTVDRLAAKLQSTRLGKFVNESTISAGVAIAYSLTVGLSQRLARSKVFALGTFGASALLGGVIAGARESVKVADERRQHSRERAKGKEFDPSMERRRGMEKTIYKTVSTKDLAETITGLTESHNVTSENGFFGAINVLAEAESRIILSDAEKIDLLSYTNFETIEKERLQLDIARAETKIRLRNLAQSGAVVIPNGQSFDEFYKSVRDSQTTWLRENEEGMEAKDRLSKKMRNKRVAGAIFKAAVTGVVIGGVAQEAGAFLSEGKEGLFEHWLGNNGGHKPRGVTALDGLRRWVMGENAPIRTLHNSILADGSKVTLPDGVEISPNPKTPGEFLFTKDGEVVSDKIQFADGKLTEASEEILKKQGVDVGRSITYVNEPHEVTTTTKGFVREHQELFKPIHRKFWYDNNTAIFDKNELRLHWGGQNGTGITADGHYAFNVAKMMPDGSGFKDLSIDAQEAIKGGKLSMLMSLSRDTQMNVVEVPIDTKGNAIIDPESPIGKMFFKTIGGKLTFIGKFAEVAHQSGLASDGAPQYEILATHVGEGVGVIPDQTFTTFTNTIVENPVTSFGVKDVDPYIVPPPFIPIFGRRPMERMSNAGRGGIGYGYYGQGLIKREDYLYRMSEELKNNPDAEINEKKEIKDYLGRQGRRHLEDVNQLIAEAGPMNPECRLSIGIPVAGHQEERVIYKTLENYLNQTADKKDFEIVVFVNHPDYDDKGKPVAPDGTRAEIERFRRDHPELRVVVMNKIIPRDQAKIGYVRKLLNDAILKRNLDRGETALNNIIVSNDADNKGVASEYIQNFLDKFEQHPETESYMGQLDWDIESYVRNPLVHIGTRLFQYVDIQLRQGDSSNIASSGANFAFRAGIYAAVNGYNSNIHLAEDVDLGRAIKAARQGAQNKRAIDFAGARVSRLFTSSRRAEKAIKDGLSPVEQWDKGFSAFDDEVRKIDWKAVSDNIDYDNPESVRVLIEKLEYVISRTMKAMTWTSKDQVIFKRALGWLGIKYRMRRLNQVEITDAAGLIAGLKKYKTEAAEILRMKTA